MLNPLSRLHGAVLHARDGDIGHLKEAYLDDRSWVMRYLVVDTGTWLPGRDVLISPYAIVQPLGSGTLIDVSLTRQQVQDSPDIDTHRPVSRQHEREMLGYYAYPEYWQGSEMWGMNALPLWPAPLPTEVETEQEAARARAEVSEEDTHLISSATVVGYDIQASDDSIGHVSDFIFDDESFAVRYLVVDTRNWWPGGTKVLVAVGWIDRVDWAGAAVYVDLTREQVRNSPAYTPGSPIARDEEQRLHDAYSRKGYWL